MKRPFDKYRDNYENVLQRSFALPGLKPSFFTRSKSQHIRSTIQRLLGPTTARSILDVGCGIGIMEAYLAPYFNKITAIDIAGDLLGAAKKNVAGVDFREYDGVTIPFSDQSFDVAFAVCVLHHLPPEQQMPMLQEMKRVVRPGGAVAIYEHNPLNPLTRLTVANCEFDEHVHLVKPRQLRRLYARCGLTVDFQAYILFFPFGGSLFRRFEEAISFLPLGAQFSLWGKRGSVQDVP